MTSLVLKEIISVKEGSERYFLSVRVSTKRKFMGIIPYEKSGKIQISIPTSLRICLVEDVIVDERALHRVRKPTLSYSWYDSRWMAYNEYGISYYQSCCYKVSPLILYTMFPKDIRSSASMTVHSSTSHITKEEKDLVLTFLSKFTGIVAAY